MVRRLYGVLQPASQVDLGSFDPEVTTDNNAIYHHSYMMGKTWKNNTEITIQNRKNIYVFIVDFSYCYARFYT